MPGAYGVNKASCGTIEFGLRPQADRMLYFERGLTMCGIFGGTPDLISKDCERLLLHRGPNQQGQLLAHAADGTPIDTATVGEKTFTVTAVDNAGNVSSVSHSYTVVSTAGPANDDFGNATAITSLPFGHVVDVTSATTEPVIIPRPDPCRQSWLIRPALTI